MVIGAEGVAPWGRGREEGSAVAGEAAGGATEGWFAAAWVAARSRDDPAVDDDPPAECVDVVECEAGDFFLDEPERDPDVPERFLEELEPDEEEPFEGLFFLEEDEEEDLTGDDPECA